MRWALQRPRASIPVPRERPARSDVRRAREGAPRRAGRPRRRQCRRGLQPTRDGRRPSESRRRRRVAGRSPQATWRSVVQCVGLRSAADLGLHLTEPKRWGRRQRPRLHRDADRDRGRRLFDLGRLRGEFRFDRVLAAQSVRVAITGAWSDAVKPSFFLRKSRSISTSFSRETTASVPSRKSILRPCLRWKAPPR